MSLALLTPDACPTCGNALTVDTIDQPAMFIHGGYGATNRREHRSCPRCGWWVEASSSEVRP